MVDHDVRRERGGWPGEDVPRSIPLPSQEILAKQVMAAFVQRAGGPINMTHLMKLVYLADKKALIKTGAPITCSVLKALPYGPVSDAAMDAGEHGLEGDADDMFLLCPKKGIDPRLVQLAKAISRSDLNFLSDVEISIIDEVWDEWKDVPQQEVIDKTHLNPEYAAAWALAQGAGQGSAVIGYLDVMKSDESCAEGLIDVEEAAMEAELVAAGVPRRLRK